MSTGGDRRVRVFADRRDAGRRLADTLEPTCSGRDVIVLGLPRGGVPVADEVARRLRAPLDVVVVRKLGAPFNPEFAVGAIASGGVYFVDPDGLAAAGLDEGDIAAVAARERAELERRERLYRGNRPPPGLDGKTAVLVDDGIATGATMQAAVLAVRAAAPREVIVAAPTASRSSVRRLERITDAVVVLQVPEPYVAVGQWYADFPQLTDDEIIAVLRRAHDSPDARPRP